MDIVARLLSYRPPYGWPEEYSIMVEPTLNHVAANEIERLRNNQSILITSFRINMMRLCPDYSHEEFDKDIAVMLKEKE